MPREQQRKRMPGGYSPASVEDEMVLEAAKFAVQALSEEQGGQLSFEFLKRISLNESKVVILKAAQQVVAGMNYKLTIALVDGDGQCQGAFKVTLYNRFGDLSVTKWDEELSCDAAKELMNAAPEPES